MRVPNQHMKVRFSRAGWIGVFVAVGSGVKVGVGVSVGVAVGGASVASGV